MPRNAEYVIAAFTIVGGVIAVYAVSILIRLKTYRNKLAQIQNRSVNEEKP